MAKSGKKADTPKTRNMASPAAIVTSPEAMAAAGTFAWSFAAAGNAADFQEAYEILAKQTGEAQKGSTKNAEAMLYGQASTLHAVFTALLRRAAREDRLPQFQVAMSMALKAQAQSRATLEALAAIKNPSQVAFVKQANIANGPQQVNNAPQAIESKPEDSLAEFQRKTGPGKRTIPHDLDS